MVATLILMIAGRGIAQLITDGVKIQIFYEPFAFLGNGWAILPFSLFVVAIVFVVAVGPDPQDRRSACSSSRSGSTPARASTAASTRSA